MVTASGLLQKGDHIEWPDGRIFEIVKRTGNDVSYGIIIRPLDGMADATSRNRHAYGYPADHMLVTEAAWHLNHGHFKLVSHVSRGRSVRIADQLWEDALFVTYWMGETVSDVVRDGITAYTAQHMAEARRRARAEQRKTTV